MLSHEELRMLAWIAQHVEGEGGILDLGPFLGGSTSALAYGAQCSSRPRHIWSYDVFEGSEEHLRPFLDIKPELEPLIENRNTLPAFWRQVGYFSDIVTAVQGDILNETWERGPIAVLFVDLSKTREINDHLVREFMPHLVPGSIVVQQDFLFFQTPWLHSTMYKLSDSIELLSHCETNSAIFGVNKTPSTAELEACLGVNTSHDNIEKAIKHFRGRFTDVRQTEMLDAALEAFRQNPDSELSWEFYSPVPFSWDKLNI